MTTSSSSHSHRRRKRRRPLLKRAAFWVPVSIAVVLIGLGVGGGLAAKSLYDQAIAAKGDLEKAIPLVGEVEKSMLAGDAAGAQATAAKIAEHTAAAKEKTDGPLWRVGEVIPMAGPNLAAARIAASSADALVRDAVVPLTALSLDALVPKDGAIDLARLTELAGVVKKASSSVEQVKKEVAGIDRGALVDQVAGGIGMLDDALAKVEPVLEPTHNALTLLPKALGADGPRNYLVLFQNNAESRGTGGNPAAIAVVTADQGRISITQQASSGDFKNDRAEPVTTIDPQTLELYTSKIGRYIQDTTLTPNFPTTAEIVRAFWAESFGTPIDGVASFDPVALSYLLSATGPVTLATGETLTAENAVPLLLNEVYAKYPDSKEQDAFFAATAEAVFRGLLTQPSDPKTLVDMLAKAANEGRLLYAPNDKDESAVIAGTLVNGTLPEMNAEATTVGVYVNDITAGKLDYYMQLDIAAETDQCEAKGGSPAFGVTATLANTLTPDQVPGLAEYISPGTYFPKGVVSTDLVVYGPVGATPTAVTVDGKEVSFTPMPHLGRNAVKVNVTTGPGQTAKVSVAYTGVAGAYGPLEVRHTPMVRPTGVTVNAPGCAAKG